MSMHVTPTRRRSSSTVGLAFRKRSTMLTVRKSVSAVMPNVLCTSTSQSTRDLRSLASLSARASGAGSRARRGSSSSSRRKMSGAYSETCCGSSRSIRSSRTMAVMLLTPRTSPTSRESSRISLPATSITRPTSSDSATATRPRRSNTASAGAGAGEMSTGSPERRTTMVGLPERTSPCPRALLSGSSLMSRAAFGDLGRVPAPPAFLVDSAARSGVGILAAQAAIAARGRTTAWAAPAGFREVVAAAPNG
mmetsp:Transcript_5991/g.15303  ORF Transcript_5991/g.15303 Transcript_5991/m.15303 type:complete len:251 (+) Transcript_5991:633-1385(+)